jgi:transposase
VSRPRTALNFENATLEEVLRAMDCTPTKKSFRRLQALLCFCEAKSYQEIASLFHFSERQILRYRQAFNARGLDGLIPGPSSGRPRALSENDMKEKIMPLVDDPAKANQSHWTAVKLHGWIKDTLQIE